VQISRSVRLRLSIVEGESLSGQKQLWHVLSDIAPSVNLQTQVRSGFLPYRC
jgi:hypothetical protein